MSAADSTPPTTGVYERQPLSRRLDTDEELSRGPEPTFIMTINWNEISSVSSEYDSDDSIDLSCFADEELQFDLEMTQNPQQGL